MSEVGAFTPYGQNEIMKRMNIHTSSTPKIKEIDERTGGKA